MDDDTDYTTITVPRPVKDALDAHRDGRPWGTYLEQLRREHADPITLNDGMKIADAVIGELEDHNDRTPVTLEATEYTKIAEEIEARLR